MFMLYKDNTMCFCLWQVTWLVGEGRMLSDRELVSLGFELHEANQSLTIQNINEEHEGHYTCVVSNPAGSAEETFYVEVLGKYCTY